MFCPKCGSQNAENVRFCRACGLELESVSAAMTGKLSLRKKNELDCSPEDSNDPDKLRNAAIPNFLVGVAFLIVSIVLAVTGAAGGKNWWFWLLLPAFWQIGSGIAGLSKAKRIEQRANYANFNAGNPAFPPQSANTTALPPRQTLFANDYAAPRNTGELFTPPASVTEHTTTHLNINTEGETINLPNKK